MKRLLSVFIWLDRYRMRVYLKCCTQFTERTAKQNGTSTWNSKRMLHAQGFLFFFFFIWCTFCGSKQLFIEFTMLKKPFWREDLLLDVFQSNGIKFISNAQQIIHTIINTIGFFSDLCTKNQSSWICDLVSAILWLIPTSKNDDGNRA